MRTEESTKAFNDYIINAIDAEGYNQSPVTETEKLQFLVDTFKKEYGHNIMYYNSQIKAFTEWMKGLPSCFNIEYRNHAILELSYLFGFIKANATEKEEDEMIEQWFYCVYINVYHLTKTHKIFF